MYAYLKGKLVYKSPAQVHLDVHGVGYEIHISLNTYSKLQHLEEACLFIYFQVKEDAHNLYGFFDREEKELFRPIAERIGGRCSNSPADAV